MSVLVIDIGSSSVRALLFDEQARLMPDAIHQIEHQFQYAPDGEASADPQNLQELTETCIAQLLQQSAGKHIQAVGMATFVGNIMGVDAVGRALTPLFTYADTRGEALVGELGQHINLNDHHQRTGCRLHPAYSTVRLAWYRKHFPEDFARVHQWMDFASYLYLQWFGEANTSYSVASWSGLLNRSELTWDALWLERLHLNQAALPKVADVTDTIQGLKSPYREQWQVLADVPFFLAVGDGAAANVGSGATDKGSVALSIGSTAALRMIDDSELPTIPKGLWGYRVTAKQHLIGGATSEGGNVYEWASATLALNEQAETQLMTSKPDSHNLTILPLLAGERAPGWQGDAKGTIHGIGLATTPLDILQALLESVALRLASIADTLLQSDATVMASGGAISASTVWSQIIANALNRPLQIIGNPETTARGVAILILSHLHHKQWSDYPPDVARVIEPQADAVTIYQETRQRQQALYQRLYGE